MLVVLSATMASTSVIEPRLTYYTKPTNHFTDVPNYYSRPFRDSRCDIFCWLRWKKQLEGYDTFRLIKEQIEKDEEHVKWTQKEYRMSGHSSQSWEYDWGYVMEGSASKEVPAKEIILGIVGVVVMLAL
jgi:hypothetical protein